MPRLMQRLGGQTYHRITASGHTASQNNETLYPCSDTMLSSAGQEKKWVFGSHALQSSSVQNTIILTEHNCSTGMVKDARDGEEGQGSSIMLPCSFALLLTPLPFVLNSAKSVSMAANDLDWTATALLPDPFWASAPLMQSICTMTSAAGSHVAKQGAK